MASAQAAEKRAAGPRVSVLTPSYKHAQYLPKYFESLLAQTYANVEVVFVDDGSPDASWAVAESYRVRLEQVGFTAVFHRNEENCGLTRTLQRCLELATGDYLAILESDDWYLPHRLERAVALLEASPTVAAVHADVDVFDEGANRLEPRLWGSRQRKMPSGSIVQDLLHENHILSCTFTARAHQLRQAVDFDRYATAGYQTVDYAMFLDLARTSKFAYCDETWAVYRVRDGSISHPVNRQAQLQWKLDYYRIKVDFIARHNAGGEGEQRRAARQLWSTRAQMAWLCADKWAYREALRELANRDIATRRDRAACLLAALPGGWPLLRLLKSPDAGAGGQT